MSESIKVWDAPTRVFHWLLAGCFVGAFLTSDSERMRDVHVMLGYTLLGLIAFRVVWGFAGTRYARFTSFAYGPYAVGRYVSSLLHGQPGHYVGHNPAGSLAIFLLLGLGLLAAMTGVVADQQVGGEWFEESHELAANAMLVVVLVHVAGAVASSLLHRENLVWAMMTGRKRGDPEEGIRQTHAWVAAVLLAAMLGFWYWYAGTNAAQLAEAGQVFQTQRHGGRHDD